MFALIIVGSLLAAILIAIGIGGWVLLFRLNRSGPALKLIFWSGRDWPTKRGRV